MNLSPRLAQDQSAVRADAKSPGGGALWTLKRAAHAAVIGIFVLALLAAMQHAQPVLLPVLLAFVFGIVLTPLSAWAARYRVPHWISALLLVAAICAAFVYGVMLLADPVRDWIDKAPEFGAVLRERFRVLDRPLAALNSLRESIAGPAKEGENLLDINIYSTLVQPMLGMLTPAVGQLIMFFATLFFFLAGRERIRKRIVTYWDDRKTRLGTLHIWSDIETNLASYFAVITGINAVLATLITAVAYLVGLPNPLVWGALAFVFNYIPYIGPAIIIVLLFAVGLLSFDTISHALIAPVFYFGASVVEGEFVTPSILGMRLALNPLLVFLAVAFWAWFWGPFGALLAVPILIVAIVILGHLFPKDEVNLPE